MPNPTELAIGILISVIVTGGFMILQEQATRVAYFIVRQCAAQLTRHRERREAEWLTQIDECPRGLSQIALAASNLGAVIKDQPSIPLMLFNMFISTALLLTRPLMLWVSVRALDLTLAEMVNGTADFADIGATILVTAFLFIIHMKKKSGDFSWYPDWYFSYNAQRAVPAAVVVGFSMVMISGAPFDRVGVMYLIAVMCVTYLQGRTTPEKAS